MPVIIGMIPMHSTIRTNIIQIAHLHPEFRAELLPLLKIAARGVETGNTKVGCRQATNKRGDTSLLRQAIIRVAYENPSLRTTLLPCILRRA